MRSTLSHPSINAQDVAGLNATFGNTLNASGVPVRVTNDFQRDMQALLQFDQENARPAAMAAKDYATLMNMALVEGLPMPTPSTPRLLTSSVRGGHTVPSRRPRWPGFIITRGLP